MYQELSCCLRSKLHGFIIPQKKKNAWKEISSKLGMDIVEAQTRYNSIRTGLSKYMKRLRGASGSGREDIEVKKEYDYVKWLLVHIKHRPSSTNIKRPKLEVSVDDSEKESDAESDGLNLSNNTNDENDVSLDDILKETEKDSIPQSSVDLTKGMSSKLDKEFMKTMSIINKTIDSNLNDESDEDRYFCLSLVGQLKKLEPCFRPMQKCKF